MADKVRLFILWLCLLAFSILVIIYGAWLLYPLEVDLLKISHRVYMTKSSILFNFNGLMDYLTNPFRRQLTFASFASSKEALAHFKDVKGLFHLTQAIFILSLYPSYSFLKTIRKAKAWPLYRQTFLLALFLPLIIALFAYLIGFDHFFILFHQILFPGKTNWSFDPLTDPIIWILPETFFRHCFLAFFSVYELIFMGLYMRGKNSKKQAP